MSNWKKIFIGVLGGMCLCFFFAYSSLAAEKVDEVVVGLNLELTGGLASATLPVSNAMLDYYRYINDQGGFTYKDPTDNTVHRAKYKILWADNGFSVARSISNVKRFIDRGARIIVAV